MTERERWIVYPLLFLALGAALRDKLFDTTMSRRIVCQELVVVDEGQYPNGPTRLARIGAAETSVVGGPRIGRIEVNGRVDAEAYFAQGVPLSAPVRMGVSLQDLYRLFERAAGQQQRGGAVPNLQPMEPASPDEPSGGALPDDATDAAPSIERPGMESETPASPAESTQPGDSVVPAQ